MNRPNTNYLTEITISKVPSSSKTGQWLSWIMQRVLEYRRRDFNSSAGKSSITVQATSSVYSDGKMRFSNNQVFCYFLCTLQYLGSAYY